jgi:pimeloyl-ACP methyl ester carboxylesterase
MIRALSLALATLVLGTPVQAHAEQVPGPGARDGAQIAGWYEISPDHKVLIVWGPTGGYRLLDFDSARFHRLEPTSPSSYRVAGDGAWENGVLEVNRDRSGRATRVTLTPTGSPPIRMPRAETYPFDMEEVRFRNEETELAGLLMVPRVRKLVGKTGRPLREVPLALPGAVFIHGSGDSDRDNVWAFTIAQHVARAGFVTLLPDKRGSGASGGDWRTTGLEGLGEDALAAVTALRADRRVDRRRIGLVGLSQGGVVAPLAAARSTDIAYVVALSAGAVTLFEQMRHEMTQDLVRARVPVEGINAISGVGDLALVYARTLADSSWSAYTTALAELSAGPFSAAAEAFPASREDWRWSWWRQVGDVDPVPGWQALDCPALAVYGEDDETDNVPVRASVRRLNEALQPELKSRNAVRIFPGLGHALVAPDRDWISHEVLAYVDDWMLTTVGGLDPTMSNR